MNAVIKNMMERYSVRKFKDEPIEESELNQIIEAGLYAPNAGSRQSAIIAVCENKEINRALGKQNASSFKGRISTSTAYISKEQPSIADDPTIGDGFYGAATVITLFAPKNFIYSEMDCCVMAENMILAAHSLGIGSCFIGRAVETFACDLGQEVLRKWEIPSDHRAFLHVILGYPASGEPVRTKPRKEGRVRRI